MTDSPVFELRNVSFGYGADRDTLADVSLSVREGEFVALLGPNGAGKTTAIRLMTGWLKPRRGEILFRGRPLSEIPRREFARSVAVVNQREDEVFSFSVEETVLMGRFPFQNPLVGFDDEEDRAIVRHVLSLVELEGFAGRALETLSGGERQRALVARALAQCPSVLLLDEPNASLDLAHQRGIFSLLARLHREHGLTIVVVLHDINLAALYCERLVALRDGRICADGPPADVLRVDVLEAIYAVPLMVGTRPDGLPHVGLIR